jgi:glycosyltransferase involved in cell wall biosynthesis
MICDVDLDVPDATRTHTLEVAAGFASEGLSVDLITRGQDPLLPGVQHHRVSGSEESLLPRVPAINWRAALLLLKRRRHGFRCYVRYKWSNLPMLFVARALRYRIVTEVNDVQYGKDYVSEIPIAFDYLKRLAAMAMGRVAHRVIAVTPQIKTLLAREFHVPPSRVAVLPNGVDTKSVRPVPRADALRRTGLDENARYLLFCGRFASWVDFDLMLAAFGLAADRHPDLRLLLVGDGQERGRIERTAEELGIQDKVIFTGFIPDRDKVSDLMGAATVALMAHQTAYVTRIGVSPTKLAEYMAAGRAVVAKDAPGVKEVLQSSGAGLVVSDDSQEMATAIESLLDNGRADIVGAAGRRTAEQNYTWQSVVMRTLSLFERP